MGIYDGIRTKIRSLFSRKKQLHFSTFQDPLGNFDMKYPSEWKFDRDIAVLEGKYTISFESRNGLERFTIAVDSELESPFDFDAYARSQLESPTSGVYTPIKKERFRSMPAYRREYAYVSSGRKYSCGGVMFFTGDVVFSLSWSAPEKDKETFDKVFARILESLVIKEGFMVRRKKQIIKGKLIEIAVMKEIKET